MNEERTRKCSQQVEHICGHLRHRYCVTVNSGQTIQWPTENGQKMIYKILHRKLKMCNRNPTKNHG